MKAEAQQAIDQVNEYYKELIEKAKSEATRSGLSKIHASCSEIVEHAKEIPSVNQAALIMTRKFGTNNHPAGQTIRNKRKGGNPYKQLFDAWKTAAIVVINTEQKKTYSMLQNSDFTLSHSDLHAIDDPTLKLQLTLLLQHNKRLKNQLDILRAVEGKPQIRHIEKHDTDLLSGEEKKTLTENETLTSQEKIALEAFIDKKLMRMRGFQWTEIGSLKTLNGDMVAKPGLLSALQKICNQCK